MSEFKNEHWDNFILGLITIAVCFYILLNIPYWLLLLNKRKNISFGLEKNIINGYMLQTIF